MSVSRSWLIACAIALVLTLGRAALQPFAGEPWQAVATDVVSVLRSLFAAVALLWAARTVREGRLPWLLLAAGAGCWFIADVIWLILAVLGSRPWGSLADVFFLLTYPFVLVGILALPRRRPQAGGAWAAVLDVGVIISAAAAAMWILLVEPVVSAGGGEVGGFAQLIAMSYPIGDLLLLWASLDLLFRGRLRSAAGVGLLLVGGAAVLILADLIYAVQILHGTYVSGNPLGILWGLGLVLLGLAGARQATATESQVLEARDLRMTTAVLAAVAMLATWIMLIAAHDDGVVRTAAAAGVLLMVCRQLQALACNRSLESDLQTANTRLEERVRERTEELAQVQRRLAEAERLEAVGRVAGAVAHDFNNILTAVSGHAELATLRCTDDAVRGHLEQIQQASWRAVELGRRLVASSRPPQSERRMIDLAAIASEVAAQIGAGLPPGTELSVEAPPEGVQAMADPACIHQVLMNLCVNARDAMPAGGRLAIRVSERDGQAEIAVSDSGCGMTEAVRARLFEPYFTTKDAGRGNGLGLATVHAIVRQHGGSIAVDTAPGRGSTFRVQLPRGLASPG